MTALLSSAREALSVLRPSEYTAALIQALQAEADLVRDASVLEIGSGSGVVLAAVAALGAASVCGIDIEADAVTSGRLLLHELGHAKVAEFHHGDLWEPVLDRRFDLIVANLPHFPMGHAHVPGRLPSWSAGGPDGRYLLDPFLEGLARHLTPRGHAIITHNAFVSVERSSVMVARSGLALRIALTTLVYIPGDKLKCMTGHVLQAEDGHSIHRYGPYAFGEMHVVVLGPHATVA